MPVGVVVHVHSVRFWLDFGRTSLPGATQIFGGGGAMIMATVAAMSQLLCWLRACVGGGGSGGEVGGAEVR